jgi:hypothetical protein
MLPENSILLTRKELGREKRERAGIFTVNQVMTSDGELMSRAMPPSVIQLSSSHIKQV